MAHGIQMIRFPVWLEVENFRLSAHRGATVFAPENSIESLQEAVARGYGAVEIDIQMSADGQIFLMHDPTVDRTTNGTGIAKDMTMEKLKSFKLKTDNYPNLASKTMRIPTFAEALEVLTGQKIVINVDGSKWDWTDDVFITKVITLLKEYKLYDWCFFVLTNKTQRDYLTSKYPDACVTWMTDNTTQAEKALDEISAYKKAFVSMPLSIASNDFIAKCRRKTNFIHVYNVESQTDMSRLKSNGVSLIETNSLLP
ncbi:glycerophosphodiester phosphodiesterase family protein [Enterococcus raffinosus]|nr:glycerophosphodiester phosphodiesterase family protein [Enterococcus raffinosus]